MDPDSGLNLEEVQGVFEDSVDFTIGLEEEFALLDPDSLDLVPRFAELMAAARLDPVLCDSVAGELISSEIEIRSGRSESFAEAVERQVDRRARLFGLAADHGVALAAMGTHPWADYRDQEIIDTPHYRLLRDELQWVARRNNTWSLHLHMGIKGADRAIAVCDHLREILPILLAVSTNSPYLEGVDTGLASVRTHIFTRNFPRCGIPDPFGDWRTYADFIDLLRSTGSIVEATQLWWSVRPHHAFGTVEVRICDAQSTAEASTALAGLMAGVVAQVAADYDEYGYAGPGAGPFGPAAGEPLIGRYVEENFWRATRHGLKGEMIDFRSGGRTLPTAEMVERLYAWSEPARRRLGIEIELPRASGAEDFRARVQGSGSLKQAYRDTVAESQAAYAAGTRA